ncbi:MAG: tetratricopeptide repeat protein [Muribaculaceae bacterium]|nr:tetratricopeptide repeat protein [Muribaculaceae bacterium]
MKRELNLGDIEGLPTQDAIKALDEFIERFPTSEDAYLMRGKKYWSLGKRKEAINDYLAALNINPEGKGKVLLNYAESILNYYSKDLLNP